VEQGSRRGKPVSRVLYWYRTPPDVKVGREPFDPAVRQALEAQNPNVKFDWRQILETPIPSADVERWRERRRTERSERAARQALEQDAAIAEPVPVEPIKHVIEAATAGASANSVEIVATQTLDSSPSSAPTATPTATPTPTQVAGGLPRRKRRRRRAGQHRRPAGTTAPPADAPAQPASGDEPATETDE